MEGRGGGEAQGVADPKKMFTQKKKGLRTRSKLKTFLVEKLLNSLIETCVSMYTFVIFVFSLFHLLLKKPTRQKHCFSQIFEMFAHTVYLIATRKMCAVWESHNWQDMYVHM
jgi:hypothetical protein